MASLPGETPATAADVGSRTIGACSTVHARGWRTFIVVVVAKITSETWGNNDVLLVYCTCSVRRCLFTDVCLTHITRAQLSLDSRSKLQEYPIDVSLFGFMFNLAGASNCLISRNWILHVHAENENYILAGSWISEDWPAPEWIIYLISSPALSSKDNPKWLFANENGALSTRRTRDWSGVSCISSFLLIKQLISTCSEYISVADTPPGSQRVMPGAAAT